MVREFGTGILTLPAEKVLSWRRVLIAEAEKASQSKGRAKTPEAELEALERKARARRS